MKRRDFLRRLTVAGSISLLCGLSPAHAADTIKVGILHSLSGTMEFVGRIARKVTVLCDGSVLAEGTLDKVQSDPRVIEVYLGR